MTIQITQPEVEAIIHERLQSGQFEDINELLAKALNALEQKEATPKPRQRPPGRKSLVELFAESPLKGLELDFSRNKSTGRPVDLS